MSQGRLQTVDHALQFILAGKATFTIRSRKTGTRFTFKVKRCKGAADLSFVSVMDGPDNECSYAYLGTIRSGHYELGRKSKLSLNAPSHTAFNWFWSHMRQRKMPDQLECWHEGKCGKCGRKLTVPESIERGIGPECSKGRG